MVKKLYEATITIYVMAESNLEAKVTARDAEEEFSSWEVEEIKEEGVLLAKWYDSIPWGEDDNRTCSQILAETT